MHVAISENTVFDAATAVGFENKKSRKGIPLPALNMTPATTYSRACSTIIGVGGLTTVFEMGTGVALRLLSPGN